MTSVLTELARSRRAGSPFGISSVCSAHPLVLRAAIRNAVLHGGPVLIEATCNQVNQFGGYTGMRPHDFVDLIESIAAEEGLARENILLGGDHLGPNPWRMEPADVAMARAEDMVAAYVEAGFRKLHLDTSMGCAGEPEALDDMLTATRAARLARAAERAADAVGGERPVYVVGTEVPPPGGAHHVITSLDPTRPEAAIRTIEIHRRIFAEAGLEDALSRVIAVVVQPGVEFGNENVVAYDRGKAQTLCALLESESDLVFEAHSTDYQGATALGQLVDDGFAILKVGPELTFALREALYGLDLIASDLLPHYPPRNLMRVMEQLMLADHSHWKGHYHGSEVQQRVQRHYSYSDRIRYYWNRPEAEQAVGHLITELNGVVVPAPLFRQYLPRFESWSSRPLDPRQMLVAAVQHVLDIYRQSTQPRQSG